ncbi:hypothetical protein [Salirhabdus salicampi]|uniref:hypothetical protein n=1 Tax=Salirhabdus salicampi TaxID=476102 RepID=UPI0020C4AF78|nr:hypothetical protein [Salirhabdus salicampi]MCP8616010.1 hypothetical protein [Salirhabdus salicampi]
MSHSFDGFCNCQHHCDSHHPNHNQFCACGSHIRHSTMDFRRTPSRTHTISPLRRNSECLCPTCSRGRFDKPGKLTPLRRQDGQNMTQMSRNFQQQGDIVRMQDGRRNIIFVL